MTPLSKILALLFWNYFILNLLPSYGSTSYELFHYIAYTVEDRIGRMKLQDDYCCQKKNQHFLIQTSVSVDASLNIYIIINP